MPLIQIEMHTLINDFSKTYNENKTKNSCLSNSSERTMKKTSRAGGLSIRALKRARDFYKEQLYRVLIYSVHEITDPVDYLARRGPILEYISNMKALCV